MIESALDEPSTPVTFDLHAYVAEPVLRWLETPATMRLVGPAFDSDEPSKALMSGGSLTEWFEALIHIGEVDQVTVLARAETPDT